MAPLDILLSRPSGVFAAVYGQLGLFLHGHQHAGERARRERTHRRCIGSEEYTRPVPLHGLYPWPASQDRSTSPAKRHFLVRSGLLFPPRPYGSRQHGAQGPSPGWPPHRRPPAGRGLARPSTVLRLRWPWRSSAWRLCDPVPADAIVARQGRDRRLPPMWGSVARPTRAGLLGRGARRAAERDPRPFVEAPQECSPDRHRSF